MLTDLRGVTIADRCLVAQPLGNAPIPSPGNQIQQNAEFPLPLVGRQTDYCASAKAREIDNWLNADNDHHYPSLRIRVPMPIHSGEPLVSVSQFPISPHPSLEECLTDIFLLQAFGQPRVQSMVQLDPADVIPNPQEQIDWNALTQSEADGIPSPLCNQAVLGVRAVPMDEGDSLAVTSAQQEEGKEEDEEEKKGKEGKGEEDKDEEVEEGGGGGGVEEREATSEILRTDEELLTLPFKELTLTEFERVERIFLGQAAAAEATAAKAAEEAEATAEVERKSNKEMELELLKIPFSKLSLTQFEEVERLFLNGGVPAELIPAIPTRRVPVQGHKQAEVTKAKEALLDFPFDKMPVPEFEEVESSFSDVEMPVMPILQNKEQTERYVIHGFGRFLCWREENKIEGDDCRHNRIAVSTEEEPHRKRTLFSRRSGAERASKQLRQQADRHVIRH